MEQTHQHPTHNPHANESNTTTAESYANNRSFEYQHPYSQQSVQNPQVNESETDSAEYYGQNRYFEYQHPYSQQSVQNPHVNESDTATVEYYGQNRYVENQYPYSQYSAQNPRANESDTATAEYYGQNRHVENQEQFASPISLQNNTWTIQNAADIPGSEMDRLTVYANNQDPRYIEPNTINEFNHTSPLPRLSGWKQKVMPLTVFLTVLLLGYDSSNSANIQIPVYEAFGHVELLPWVSASFSLSTAAAAPLVRRLMEVMNPKWFLIIFWLISLSGGAVAGAANNIQSVIIGRVLMGIGVSGVYLCVFTHLRLLLTHTEFARINGLIGMGFAMGLIFGPIMGGAFAENEHTTWRWAFYITIPWVALLVGLYLCWFPSMKPVKEGSSLQNLRNIDWLGMVLHVASLVLLISALLTSGTSWAWNSGSSIAIWIFLPLVLVLYFLQQKFCWFTTIENRAFPVSIIQLRVGLLVLICTLCSGAAYGVPLFYLPLFYGFTREDSPIQVGVHLIPFLCVFVFFSLISGILLPRIRRYATLYLVGGLLITVGSGQMVAMDEQASLAKVMGLSTIISAGVGLTFQLGTATFGVVIPPRLRTESFVVITQGQYVGISSAVSIAGCIFQNEGFKQLQSAIGGLGFSDSDIRNALAGLRSPILQGGNKQITILATSILSSLIIKLFYLVIPAGILMLLCVCMMSWEALNFEAQNDSGK